ncbi:HMG box [Dictyocaulus viviparus]|uniref:HMG box n=1 Tax=Dictyocaulus viviparus TaxID=29172 RepID=A0A0D8Y975_DICVI|nr:HMG box [Dictyocaulus viviparus]
MEDFSMYHIPYTKIDWRSIQPTFFQGRNSVDCTVDQTEYENAIVESENCLQHENSRPISAYAIFFKERQILIKKSSPKASFGEISRAVASEWELLDDEEKLKYKKKSEQIRNTHMKMAVKDRLYRICTVDKEPSFSSINVDQKMSNSNRRDVLLRKKKYAVKRKNS